MWRILVLLFLLVGCSSAAESVLPTLVPLPVEIRTLQPWVLASGVIDSPDLTNEWQFAGQAGEQIRVRAVSQSATIELVLMLRGMVLAQGTTVELTLPEDEIYRVSARLTAGSGTYDIGLSYTDQENPNQPTLIPQVVGVPTPTPAFVVPGEYIRDLTAAGEVSGILTAQSNLHIYNYQGVAGDTISLDLRWIAGTIDPVLIVYDRDGVVIAQDDNSGGAPHARLLNIVLSQTGLYSIQVSGKGLYGDYLLQLRTGEQSIFADLVATVTATTVAPYVTPTVGAAQTDARLTDHVPVIGNLSRAGDFQRFAFAATAGSTFSVRAAPYGESSVLPRLEVFGIEGELLASAQTVASADNLAFASRIQAAQSGVYIIIVTADNSSSGAYVISAGMNDTVEDRYLGMMEANVRTDAALTERGERHVWQVLLHPGDVIIAAASPQDNLLDPVLEIADASSNVLYRDDNSGDNRAALIRSAAIEQPATYLLRVYDAGGDATGSYTLLWRYINRAPAPTPAPRTAVLLSIADQVTDGSYQHYAFQGRAGQRVLIEVRGKSGLDPVAALLAPDGTTVAEGDDNGTSLNPRFEATLPQDGRYLVRVNGYLSVGEFDLSVALLLDITTP
jgi:hypothetical protein